MKEPKKQQKKALQKNSSKNTFIVGLGNPGNRYYPTLHNVGFWFVEGLADYYNLKPKKRIFRPYKIIQIQSLFIVEPLMFMNRSGEVLSYLFKMGLSHSDQLVVVCDNLDLPPGKCRMKKGGSSAGHNGLKSIIGELGSADFYRLYIGIGRPSVGTSVVDHVLSAPSESNAREINSSIEKCISLFGSIFDDVLEKKVNGPLKSGNIFEELRIRINSTQK